MNLKDFAKHLVLSFFIIFSGIVLSSYVILLIFDGRAEIRIESLTMTSYIIIAVLTNLTQVILYSRKELSPGQNSFRRAIAAFLVVAIALFASFYLEGLEWAANNYLMILVVTVMVLVIMAVKNIQVSTAAFIDPMTKAYNKRHFIKIASNALDECIKNDRQFSLIMLDLDRFKSVNDTYGHSVGDEVLRITVARVSHVLKSGTIVARYGDEEFVVMITDVAEKDIINIAWRLQKNLAVRPFVIGELSVAVTASFGIASKSPSAQSLTEIINNSEQALAKAKAGGRNTVVCYEHPNAEVQG